MKHRPTRFAALLLAALLLLGITGCGGGAADSESIRLMVWSASEDQAKDSGEWLQTCCAAFAAQHPEWNLTFVYGVADEATAASTVSQDPEASADVFLYANDNLTVLTDAKALAKIGGKYADEVRSFTSEALVDSVTLDGYLYGVPFTTNTWYMYYDKRVFSEEDVQSLDAMLEKGVVSFPFTNSWYLPAFYFGNGCTLFGDGTQEELGADFGGENAVEVTDFLVDLIGNPNFVVDADGSGMAGLRDGSISAIFTGSWDSASIKEILGDNMGVAALPTYSLNGQEKQMYAYAGSKAVGVNSRSENMVAAVELAVYLGSAEAQRLHYDLRSVIPSNTELMEAEDIAADPVVIAQNDTFDRTSKLQPFVSKMSNCWTPVENMGKAIRNGSTTHDNAAEQTVSMNDAMNSDGIS
ncbi:MAG: extracellular solute-binding protein [Oscillospiraceae bacterium]|nr:extracellular solute-binding protein [Oscillospiraceae bacterium]